MATAKEKAAQKKMKAELGYDEWGNPIPLPNKPTWANRHPNQAALLEQAQGHATRMFPFTSGAISAVSQGVGAYMNPPQQYGLAPGGAPLSQGGASEHAKGPSVTMPVMAQGEFPPMPERNPGRDYQAMHNLGRAGALKQAMSGYLDEINKQYGVADDEAEVLLHNFADSARGSAVTDGLVRGKRDRAAEQKARSDYKAFVSSWKAETTKSKTVDIPKPVPVKAQMLANNENVAKVVKAIDKKPAVITDASDLGFASDTVLVVKGDTPVKDVEAVVASPRTPVVTQKGFIDVMKYLRP